MFAACTMLLSCRQPSSVQAHGGVASSFRHPRKDQLCQVVKVFTAPSDDAFFGRIGSFYPQYYDPAAHKTIPSFNVRATISGELVTVWRSADDMLRLYIDERDPELKQCVPDIEPDPYTPGDWEVPSSAPIPTRAPHPR
jgi:hypothetical protein